MHLDNIVSTACDIIGKEVWIVTVVLKIPIIEMPIKELGKALD